ncbi:MAG: hypothetical protein ACI4DO_02900 [Roseburia sp.]
MALIYALAGIVSAVLLWYLSRRGYCEKFRLLIKGICRVLSGRKSGDNENKSTESGRVVAGLLTFMVLSAALWPAEMASGAISQENESQYSARIYTLS